MARLLAIEWDAREVRVAVARTAGREVEVDDAFAVDLGEGAEAAEAEAVQRLAAAVQERGLGRGEVLVAVPRGKVELRLLQTPAASDEELPDLVRFQALRQFAGMDNDWPLDFLRLASPDETQARVLAAAAAPKLIEEVQAICQAAVGPPKRLVLRPCASASLLHRRAADERCRLLVELSADEVDLTVLVGGQAVLLRSVRLSAMDLTWLIGEIRRTMVAAQNQLGDQSVDAVVLCGSNAEYADLVRTLGTQLNLPVELFDPFTAVALAPRLRQAVPAHPGRYAALLGMLQDEAAGRAPAIDFLNPRRRPPPPNRRRLLAIAGMAAVVLIAVLGGLLWAQLGKYDARIKTLKAESADCEADVKRAQKLHADLAEIDKFAAGDVCWLDELHGLSQRLPPPEQAIVDQLAAQCTLGVGGGQLELDGFVADQKVIEAMENSLRVEGHQVVGAGGTYDERQGTLKWKFKERITVAAPPAPEAEVEAEAAPQAEAQEHE